MLITVTQKMEFVDPISKAKWTSKTPKDGLHEAPDFISNDPYFQVNVKAKTIMIMQDETTEEVTETEETTDEEPVVDTETDEVEKTDEEVTEDTEESTEGEDSLEGAEGTSEAEETTEEVTEV